MTHGKAGRLAAGSVKSLQSYKLFYNCQVAHGCPVFAKRVLPTVVIYKHFVSLSEIACTSDNIKQAI